MPHLVAAYATTPCQTMWEEALETAYYEGLAAIPLMDGLEIPFAEALHPHDEAWLLRWLPRTWRHVVTCLPGTMNRLAAAPQFGLASEDRDGRAAALDFARAARAGVQRLNDAMGVAAVLAVELHSAPTRGVPGVRSSAAALAESLAELAGLDWEGARLVVEHCDAFTPAHPPQKGFLPLDEELDAIARAGAPVGMSINWGRSVLETRDAATGSAQIARVAAAGRLAGVMFSGCSGAEGQPYGVWQDSHMPHAPAPGLRWGVAHSLLTTAAIAESLAAGEPQFVGVKVGGRPTDLPVAQRVGVNRELAGMVFGDQTRP